MRTKGKITSWNESRGYGYILPLDGGRQVFIHVSAFSNRGRHPEVGQVVTYSISTDRKGRPCAVNATLAGDRIRVDKRSVTESSAILLALLFIGIVGLSVISGKLPVVILALYGGLSVLTYFAYAIDKSAARKGTWRTQESTLHLFALAGGWPGALIAQQRLRHKSRKETFRSVFWLTVLLNVGGFMWLFTPTGSDLLNSIIHSAIWG